MPTDETSGTEQVETRAIWYCIDCHQPTPLDDVVFRSVSGRCICAHCWQVELRERPLDDRDLARAFALTEGEP